MNQSTNIDINQLQAKERAISSQTTQASSHGGTQLLNTTADGQATSKEVQAIINEILSTFEESPPIEFTSVNDAPMNFKLRLSKSSIQLLLKKDEKHLNYQFAIQTTVFKVNGKEADASKVNDFLKRLSKIFGLIGDNKATYSAIENV